MEKILIAIDTVHPDQPSIEFACFLAALTKSRLTGIFLEDSLSEIKPLAKNLQATYADSDIDELSARRRERSALIERSIYLFKHVCTSNKVNFYVHKDGGTPSHELVKESRFADLLIVNANLSVAHRQSEVEEQIPTQFVQEILANAECPVVIAPETFDNIEEVVFTYNKSESAIYAIKQFTYLFPQLHNRKITILHINETGDWVGQDRFNLHEWLGEHYADLHFETLKGDVDYKLFEVLFKRRNIFLVMGAFGRSALSQFFNPSHARDLIRIITQPIFIAHL